jgi:hypothetical protein
MITKMVIAIIVACFGAIMTVNGLISFSIDGLGDKGAVISLSAGFMCLIVSSIIGRASGLVEGMRTELTTGVRILHESAVSVVAIVVGVWSISYAFIAFSTHGVLVDHKGILLLSLGFALLLIGFRHLRKTGWFEKLQEEAKA